MKYVSIEWINFLYEEMKKINNYHIEEIVFTEDGEELCIPQSVVDKFSMCGLNNMDFILSGYYKMEEVE